MAKKLSMKRTIVMIITAIILAGGLVAEYWYLNKRYSDNSIEREPPPTKKVGSFESFSGAFSLYMHKELIKVPVDRGFVLREGHRLETKASSWAIFDGCLSEPEFTLPVKFYLRENSAIGLMRPPAIDIEKGSFAVHVPKGSMGIRVNIKLLEHPISAQCLTEDGDMLVVRENDYLSVYCLRGTIRLWNMQGETFLNANQKGKITPGKAPEDGEPFADYDVADDVKKFFGQF